MFFMACLRIESTNQFDTPRFYERTGQIMTLDYTPMRFDLNRNAKHAHKGAWWKSRTERLKARKRVQHLEESWWDRPMNARGTIQRNRETWKKNLPRSKRHLNQFAPAVSVWVF